MEFVRSLTAFSTGCRLGAREQVREIREMRASSNEFVHSLHCECDDAEDHFTVPLMIRYSIIP